MNITLTQAYSNRFFEGKLLEAIKPLNELADALDKNSNPQDIADIKKAIQTILEIGR